MAFPNEVYRFDSPAQKLTIGDITIADAAITSTQSFKVPKGAKSVTVFVPDLATSTAIVPEGLTPNEPTFHTTQTWKPLSIVNLTDSSLVTLSFADNKTFTIPTTALGGGILRWTCADTQAGAPLNIYMVWHFEL